MFLTNLSMAAMRVYTTYSTRSNDVGYGIYLIIFLAMMILPLIAHFNVTSTFKKYSAVRNSRGLTADQVARMILDANGLYNVSIEHIRGNLSDHYDPKANVVRLSDAVFGQTSVAAIGVAAHECGHACQHAEEYKPILIRSKLVPVTNFCSFLAVIVFQIVTLPCEFNASSRALKTLEQDNILETAEIPQARKVLTAAALTYVTSLVVSVLQLLRLLLSVRRR